MLNRLRSVVRALVGRRRFEDAMTEEMRFHMETYAADLARGGLSPVEAARRARMAFGNVDNLKQDARQARGLRLLDELAQDLRYAARLMRKGPGFTAAAVISLGLGIGANTAIFSLIDAVFLRTLPVEDPQQLYFLGHGSVEVPQTSSNYPLLERYRTAPVFSGVTAFRAQALKVHIGESIELVPGQYVSGNYHAVVRAPMILGRGFTDESDRVPGGSPLAVISESFWTQRFGRAPDILEKTLSIRGTAVSIVGVTAAIFSGLVPGNAVDVTLPLSMYVADQPDYLEMHDTFTGMPILARLHADVPESQAVAVIDAIFQQYMSEPENAWARKSSQPGVFDVARLEPAAQGSARLRRQYATALRVLMVMVALVLLIAAANVANLLLARSSARAKEVAIRLCVGGGRARLIRQFLTESAVLAVAGGLVGVWLASWGTQLIVGLLATGPQPLVLDVSPNARVLAFTAAVALTTGLLFGLAPAFRATALDLTPALKENGAAPRLGRGRWGVGKALVAAQLALCVLVVAVAALLTRTVYNLKAQDAGFEPHGVITFSVDAFRKPFTRAERDAHYRDLLERLSRLPGVVSVSGSMSIPVHTSGNARALHLPGLPETFEARYIWTNPVTPGYFTTMGILLRRGRTFTPDDRLGTLKVGIINETAARYLFGTEDPLGRTVAFMNTPNDPIQIIGLAPDTHQTSLREPPPRMLYTPLSQEAELPGHLLLAIRTANERQITAGVIRGTVRDVTPDLVADAVRTMARQIDDSLVRERALTSLSGVFALLALLLACVGLYGVMSYQVTQRVREIGIRLALGARRGRVLAAVLRETLAMSLTGVAIGIGAALLATGAVSTFLFGLSPRDPVTLAGVSGVLIVTTLIAGYLPARRAARIDPARAIRCE